MIIYQRRGLGVISPPPPELGEQVRQSYFEQQSGRIPPPQILMLTGSVSPQAGGLIAWLAQHQTAVLAGAGALLSLAVLKGGRR